MSIARFVRKASGALQSPCGQRPTPFGVSACFGTEARSALNKHSCSLLTFFILDSEAYEISPLRRDGPKNASELLPLE